MAAEHTLSVTVLASGHPHNVFDSASISNPTPEVEAWTSGRWTADRSSPSATPPARSTPLPPEMLARGVTEVGSPWDLDGPGNGVHQHLHQDHLHLAFDS